MSKLSSKDFTWLITNRSITIGFNGETKTIKKEDGAYDKLIAAIVEEKWDSIHELLDPANAVASFSQGEMRVEYGQVIVKSPTGDFNVPSDLNKTILEFIEKDLPFKPLVNFAINLSQNPSYNSVEQLFGFLNRYQFTITDEGKFIAYKGVRKDFKDCYSGTFDNSVGMEVRMDRSGVDADVNQTCSRGLHCSTRYYADSHYGNSSNGQTIFVEVNPADVVAVPADYNGQKMRVCGYKVLGLSEREITERIYHDPSRDMATEDDLEEEEDDVCAECGDELDPNGECYLCEMDKSDKCEDCDADLDGNVCHNKTCDNYENEYCDDCGSDLNSDTECKNKNCGQYSE